MFAAKAAPTIRGFDRTYVLLTTMHPHAFEETEYRRRVEKTKAGMAEQGIEILLCSHPANMCYLTGYDGWSFYVHQLVLIAAPDCGLGLLGREPIPMRKRPTGEPCAGKPHARFGGRGGR